MVINDLISVGKLYDIYSKEVIEQVEIFLTPYEIKNESSNSGAYLSSFYYRDDWADVEKNGIEVGRDVYVEINRYSANYQVEIWVGENLITTLVPEYNKNNYTFKVDDTSKVTFVIKDYSKA